MERRAKPSQRRAPWAEGASDVGVWASSNYRPGSFEERDLDAAEGARNGHAVSSLNRMLGLVVGCCVLAAHSGCGSKSGNATAGASGSAGASADATGGGASQALTSSVPSSSAGGSGSSADTVSGPNGSASMMQGAASASIAATSPSLMDAGPTSSSAADGAASTPLDSGVASELGIRVEGRGILVNGSVFHLRGVNWNPVPKGQTHPAGLAYAALADTDVPLMQAAGINAVRTYERLEDRAVLDKLHAAGIGVFSTVLGWWQDDASVVVERVNAVKDHPAILGWVLGNEWNYNHLYGDGNSSEEQTRDKINAAAGLIKSVDAGHLVVTIWGGVPPKSVIDAMPDIDVWGLNIYSGLTFGSAFDDYAQVSSKPMFLGEYGADAYNANVGGYDPQAQATAVQQLTEEIVAASPLRGGAVSGGFVFEWADEWWKDGAGSVDQQDVGGIAPGGGPYPDATFNEEWWGLVDIDRKPRPAYDALLAIYTR